MTKPNTPFVDLLPPLATEEFEALKASIKTDGVRHPVFEDEDGNILDGHHRLKIDPNAPRKVIRGLSPAEKQAFVFQCNFVRRNLSPSQKKEATAKMKAVAKALREEDAKKNTQKRVADLLGVSRQYVSDWFVKPRSNAANSNTSTTTTATTSGNSTPTPSTTVQPNANVKIHPKHHAKIYARVMAGESQTQLAADFGVSQRQISNIVRKEQKQAEQKKVIEEAAAKTGDAPLGIHHGDFRQSGSIVADGSLDLIFTDPPYDENSALLYGDLAAFAKRTLRTGGWCLAYSGQAFLPNVLESMRAHLDYGWVFGIIHAGGDLRFRKYKLQNGWKPIVGFYRPPLAVWWDWFKDIASGGKEKADHAWQQALSEAEHFIGALSQPNGLVCDPFCGSGTSCLAAKSLGRRWIGFDVDIDAVKSARVKVHDAAA